MKDARIASLNKYVYIPKSFEYLDSIVQTVTPLLTIYPVKYYPDLTLSHIAVTRIAFFATAVDTRASLHIPLLQVKAKFLLTEKANRMPEKSQQE